MGSGALITTGVATVNIALGLFYLMIGALTIADMYRSRATMGSSHFGLAFIAIAFTCGPHHLGHGIHVALEGRTGGILDLLVVLVGLPAGAIWALLRLEAFTGGRGDRHIAGTPKWLMAIPFVAGVYLTAVIAAMLNVPGVSLREAGTVIPNLVLVVIFMAIGYFLIRTQLANRNALGGWSVSGLALSAVFPTCAVMHGVYAYYGLSGLYHVDAHGLIAGWLAIPAGAYFLWVVRALYRGTYRDWNSSKGALREAAQRAAAATA